MSAVTLSTSNAGSVTNNNNTNNGAIELTESGGRALKLQTDAPHLVSLGGGRLSTAVTLHPIPQGRITLGSGPGVDIVVQGTGVEALHCHIENSGGIVTLYPLSENLSVDGVNVSKPVRLSQGVMLTIGRSNYLRFNHPAEAQLMKSVLPNARISMAPIKFNLENNEDVQYATKKPPTIPRRNSEEDPPTNNIQMKVSKFEYLAAQNFKQSISPKVFSSNSVTVNTPAKDVLGRAPPDLQDFAKNLPQPAINYSDSSYNDKQKNKTLDRQFFGRKSPQYVNVAVNNDTKAINNRVAIYENGCIPKQPNVLLNVNLDQQPKNELNNMNNKTINTNQVNKSLNVNRTPPPVSSFNPSPSFNRNQPQYFRSVTPNPSPNTNINLNRKSSGSLNELNKSVSVIFDQVSNEITQRREDAETRRNQAHADRVKEQQIEKAEQARLEEILSMCAEYERQAQWEKNNKPTPNRIKTNGSLPRDKRQCPPSPYSSSSPIHATPSPNSRDGSIFQFDLDKTQNEENCSYENVSLNRLSPRDTNSKFYYENVEIRSDNSHSNYVNSYENVHIIQPNSISPYPHSPRTRIKTIPTLSKESSPKDPIQLIDHKFSILSAEQTLLENLNKEIPSDNKECFDTPYRKPTPTKNVLLMEKNCEFQTVAQNTFERNKLVKEKNDADKQKLETLKKKKHEISTAMANTKRKMTEIRMQEEELNRELEMERALINGEYKSKLLELEEVENRKQKLIDQAREIELKMKDCQVTQSEHQDDCKLKLDQAQENMNRVEEKLNGAKKGSSEYQELFEEFLSAQEILDNERKTFEDLEFHHLEEEADWLATREEIQREILDLSKRIDMVKTQISELEQQTIDTSQHNIKELAVLETQLIKCLQALEEKRVHLKTVESEMRNISKQESDQEGSSDSDSDKPKGINNFRMTNMSCSFIDTRTSSIDDVIYNMSQSFNEKMLQEKSILEGGMVARRCPSQDDIDRISKVTSSAPISIEDGRGSLGKKTIESLKEIERNRQLHLVQEGSKVIEEERRRVFELKQRAQNEVRTEWAKRQQNCSSLTSIESDDLRNSITGSDEIDQNRASREEKQNENDVIVKKLHSEPESPESPRPLSETSDISVEVGPLGKRKPRQNLDKTRPLTRYLPIRSSELDLRQHIESAGHQVVLCPHVIINSSTCRGFLHKKGSKLNGWSRRWFVLDRLKRTFVYYSDKSEKKVRGGAYFQAIEEVYLDHSNSVKSPNPHLTFIVKTHQRHYYLMAPSPEAMRIWIDVVFTGAEGYQEFEHGT